MQQNQIRHILKDRKIFTMEVRVFYEKSE
jgi:hypothetical protein